jgi:cytochrome c oxidase cbb3-type subunit III
MTTENINHTDPAKAAEIDQHHAADEHNYDGIEELDNPPPGWIMFIFYLTIGFSILYGAYYFWIGVGPDQHEEYARAVLQAQGPGDGENAGMLMALLTDEASIAEGKTIWADMNCATCHGPDGGGNAIGPNLTDEFWINGCDFEAVFNIIKNGQPLKGMTPFKTQLSDERIQKVASYVLASLTGTTPQDPKEPQGEKCEQ